MTGLEIRSRPSIKKIAELLNAHPNVKEIRVSIRYKEGFEKVWDTLEEMGIKVVFFKPKPGRPFKYDRAFREKAAKKAIKEGIRKTARQLGIPKSTLMDWVNEWKKEKG